jgi:anti-sigma28 factor (negative regulator of flagellin synthesis)
VARADERRKRGVASAVAPADREALCLSLIVTGGAVRQEKIARLREQIRHGTYHIRAAEVAQPSSGVNLLTRELVQRLAGGEESPP